MPLDIISCPDCGRQVSTRHHRCPFCGYDLRRLFHRIRWLAFFLGGGLLGLLCWAIASLFR